MRSSSWPRPLKKREASIHRPDLCTLIPSLLALQSTDQQVLTNSITPLSPTRHPSRTHAPPLVPPRQHHTLWRRMTTQAAIYRASNQIVATQRLPEWGWRAAEIQEKDTASGNPETCWPWVCVRVCMCVCVSVKNQASKLHTKLKRQNLSQCHSHYLVLFSHLIELDCGESAKNPN